MAKRSAYLAPIRNPAEAAPTPPNCRAWEPGQLVLGQALSPAWSTGNPSPRAVTRARSIGWISRASLTDLLR
jgi:hypothetical protein